MKRIMKKDHGGKFNHEIMIKSIAKEVAHVQQKIVIKVCFHPHLNLILIHLKGIEEVVPIQQIPIQRIKGIVIGLVHLKELDHLIPIRRIHLVPIKPSTNYSPYL